MWEVIGIAAIVIVIAFVSFKAYGVGYENGYTKGIRDCMRDCDEKIKNIFNRIDSSNDDGFRVRDTENKPKLS